jgi:hypothetical protein
MAKDTSVDDLDAEAITNSHSESQSAVPNGIPSGAVTATKKGIEAALKIKEIQRKVGFCSLEKLAEAYDNGSVDFPKNLAITSRQIRRADALLGAGDDPDRIRGRAQFPRNVPASAEQRVDIVGGELVMQIDLMFEEGLAFLVSIVDPTAHMLVDHIDSKSAESI